MLRKLVVDQLFINILQICPQFHSYLLFFIAHVCTISCPNSYYSALILLQRCAAHTLFAEFGSLRELFCKLLRNLACFAGFLLFFFSVATLKSGIKQPFLGVFDTCFSFISSASRWSVTFLGQLAGLKHSASFLSLMFALIIVRCRNSNPQQAFVPQAC